MREKIISCLGEFPKRAALDLEIELIEEKEGIYQKLISYNVERDERVKAYLLEPKNVKPNTPAILAIHQHAGKWHLGKSEVAGLGGDAMYHYGLDLVKRGYVVIVPDLLCFEDRIKPHFQGDRESHRMYERFEFLKYISFGKCLQTKYLHDLSVAVDVLESFNCVDKNNIGVIGHSLGGQEATWMMFHDLRLKAGVSSCGISTIDSIFENNVLHNFALYVPGMSNICDMDEVVSLIAPRSFLMTNGSKDVIFPIEGVKKIAESACSAYGKLGVLDNFKSIIFDGGHKFGENEKKIAYEWLDEKLKG